jgi:glycosyltransferase involved in cell wall biosynthesis
VGDSDAFAAAARRLLDEPGLRSRLAEGGRVRAQRLFSAEAMARKSVQLYESILGDRAWA